ncbi:MAG: GH3 auxin-responsive promoter family protein [Maritimibacter sp.]|nr:GH3 auxin-responsive promoter family protein [Maritimibacter sp.]
MKAEWRAILSGCDAAARAFAAARADPGGSQRTLLGEIVAANAATAFGRAHGFDRIDSYEAYRDAVPIRGYDGFSGWIAEMAAGAPGRLVADPPVAFERTGGTTSGGKLVPYTAAQIESFGAAVRPMLHDLLTRVPAIGDGRLYASISPATRAPEVTAGGIPVGLGSDAAYLGQLAAPFARLLAVPPEVGAMEDIEAWRIATLAGLVEAGDLSFVSVWSPSFFTALVEALPRAADEVLPRLGPPARARLERWLAAGPEGGTALLWPRLAAISTWTDAGSAPFAKRLAALCPQATIARKGVIATEGAVMVPTGEGPGAWPALTSSFLEFRDPATGICHLADGLDPGAVYEAILTTRGGFYRYDIGDRFRCLAIEHGCPRLVFEGRSGVVSDMVGEKLDEGFVARVLAGLDGPARLEARPGPPPHYRLARAPGTGPADLAALDRALGANPQYAYARRIGQLGPLVDGPGGYDPGKEAAARARAGQRLGDAKPGVLLPPLPAAD